MRILVVEDEQKVAKALKEGLEDEHYEVVVANTGEDAYFRITTEKFDLIVLDINLPGRDGLGHQCAPAAASIRGHSRAARNRQDPNGRAGEA